MKILADQCVHFDVVEQLRKLGCQVEHTSQIGLARADDDTVFRHACRSGQILLSFDKDFGNIAHFPVRNSYGVVIIYIEGMSRQEIIDRSVFCFRKFIMKLNHHGRLFVVESNQIRIWPK